MLAVAFGLIGIGAKALDYYLLSQQEAELKQTFNAEYRQMLPGAPEVNDPAAVIESLRRRIGAVETAPLFLQSMEQLSKAIWPFIVVEIIALFIIAYWPDLVLFVPRAFGLG